MGGEQTLQNQSEVLEDKNATLLAARTHRQEYARELAQVAAVVSKCKEEVVAARKRVKSLPLVLNKAKWELEQAKVHVTKLRCGPIATYTRVLPLPDVGSNAASDEILARAARVALAPQHGT